MHWRYVRKVKAFLKIFSLHYNSIFINKTSPIVVTSFIYNFSIKTCFPFNLDARIIPYRKINDVFSITQPLVDL